MVDFLNTGLKPAFGLKTAKVGSDNIEGFLTEVKKSHQRGFLTPTFERPNKKTREIYKVLHKLKKYG